MIDQAQRERIRTALSETLVVEAAAGTGKTTELVQRIVNVLECGRARVHEIVAVTFTEKAAGELKLRLREALDRARAGAPTHRATPCAPCGDPGTPAAERIANLERALERLEEARINTIHGFCADLLRERPVEARVDPLFTVLTEDQAQAFYDQAFSGWIQEQLAEPPEGVRRALRRSPRSFGGWSSGSSSPFPTNKDEEGPIDRLRAAGWRLVDWRDFPGEWSRPDFDREHKIKKLVQSLHLFAELTEQKSYERDNLYLDTAAARRVSQEIKLMEQFQRFDLDGWEARLVDLSRDRSLTRARKGSGHTYGNGVLRSDVLDARQRLVDELDRFRDEADADLAALVRRDLRGSVERYEQLKARDGALDFLDLLIKTCCLLRDKEDVRRRLQGQCGAIFVDEFQDTDPLQAEILLLLAAADPSVSDWRLVTPVPGKLFIVGDPKQSIYRFRRADVGTYRAVCEHLEARGAVRLQLTTSFRSRPAIQRCINAAFAPVMTDDPHALQAAYVPLSPFRTRADDQAPVVVLPVPRPYARTRIAASAVEASLPDAVAAFVDWLVNESGWKVAERPSNAADTAAGSPAAYASRAFEPGEAEQLVKVEPRHISVLFRRFLSFSQDVTRPYVAALEAREIPHLLVGGKTFHDREEVDTLRTALAAIEWPDDELSVFATLRGALFAIGDEELLEYRHRFGRLQPFRIPHGLNPESRIPNPGSDEAATLRLTPIAEALGLLRRLHSGRNYRPVADTISMLLDATRAHVGFVLRSAGEQALANVLHLAELARQYELGGGISFRGFVETLQKSAEREQAPEAPILEEGSDGVRLMTVHKAKGLEFPVVILADMTAKLRPFEAGRHLDPERRLCALRLAGWSPIDLLEHDAEESAREQAEGVRLAYVAATRARDLLVVPAIGDEPWEGGWLEPLNGAIYPALARRRTHTPAPGCPVFRSKDSVVSRPNDDPAGEHTVCPGLHVFQGHSRSPVQGSGLRASGQPGGQDDGSVSHVAHGTSGTPHLARRTSHDEYSVVWWDPNLLAGEAAASFGVRHEDLIVKDVSATVIADGLTRYNDWRRSRDAACQGGASPSASIRTVGEEAESGGTHPGPDIEVIELGCGTLRPFGPRFGSLVHALLAAVPLEVDHERIEAMASLQGRLLGAPAEEVDSATLLVAAALQHPLFDRARAADRRGLCRRETPVTLVDEHGALLEGVVDLAFREEEGWIVVDFKTDRESDRAGDRYRRQVRAYVQGVSAATRESARGILVRL